MDQTVINFACYEDNREFIGLATATLPDIGWINNSLSGAGIAGNIESVVLGHMEAMTLGLSFHTVTRYGILLAEPRIHIIDLRVAQQEENTVESALEVVALKHVFKMIPKAFRGGSVSPAAPGDPSGEYAVRYWATDINGRKTLELDPLNNRCFVNGRDYLAPVKAALGK